MTRGEPNGQSDLKRSKATILRAVEVRHVARDDSRVKFKERDLRIESRPTGRLSKSEDLSL
ncbi:MAG: hypothetical protein SNH01_08945 [Rikenellaceae bacterium]